VDDSILAIDVDNERLAFLGHLDRLVAGLDLHEHAIRAILEFRA
jgi:hypothetical protein